MSASIAAWTQEVQDEEEFMFDYPDDARLVFRIRGEYDIADILVDELLLEEELGSVTMFFLRCSPPLINLHVWGRLFSALPNLRRLTLDGRGADMFTEYHNSPISATYSRTHPSPLYPSLKQLKLSCALFRRCWSGPHEKDLLPDLVTALATATGQGLHLERLEIEASANMTDEDLDTIRSTRCAEVVEMMDDGLGSVGACSTADHEPSEDEEESEYEDDDVQGTDQDTDDGDQMD